MKLLALDTSSDACSVALATRGELIERHVVRPKEHTRLLLPMIEEVLREAGARISDLDAIVPGIGPGSFIGVRIAVSVAQGLAFAGGKKVVPVSSLAAVAAEVFSGRDVERVAIAQDAHMQEVYLALFERDDNGLPVALGDAVLHGIGPVATLATPAAGAPCWHAAGAGWQRHPELLAHNRNRLAGVLDVLRPRARFLLPLAASDAGAAVPPERLVPAYVRTEVARVPGRADGSDDSP